MLTTYLFKNVLLRRDYSDVIRFENQNDVISYLQANYTYQVLTDEIRYDFTRNTCKVLKSYYSNVNYIAIYDSEIEQYRFYFVDNEEITSTNTITLFLKLDVWATFADTITMYNSNIVGGHIDEYDNVNSYICNINGINTNGANYTRDYLLEPKEDDNDGKTFAVIVEVIPSTLDTFNFIGKNNPYFITRQFTNFDDAVRFLVAVSHGKIHYVLGGGETTTFTYNIASMYIIPNVVLPTSVYDYQLYDSSGQSYIYLDTGGAIEYFTATHKVLFTETKTLQCEPNKKYHIGTINDGIDIENENVEIEIKFQGEISFNGQFNCGIYISNKYVDLTEQFSVANIGVNAYSQWYYQNKNQLALQNKAQYLQSGLQLLGGLGALATGTATGNPIAIIGGLSTTTQAITSPLLNKEQQNAKIKDAKNSLNRYDNTSYSAILTLLYGVFIDTIDYDNANELIEDINLNGYTFNIENTPYLPLTSNTYKFYCIKTTNCKLIADTTYENIKELQDIFNNGTRVWYDRTNYLTKINYK